MPSWVWHSTSGQWRIWSDAEAKWVLQDGTRVAPSPPQSSVEEEAEEEEEEADDPQEQASSGSREARDVVYALAGSSRTTYAPTTRSALGHQRNDTLTGITEGIRGIGLSNEAPVHIRYSDPQEDEEWKHFADPVLLVQGARSFTKISAGSQDKLDPRFKPRPPSFFSRGKVFKVLWPEPRGDLNSRITIVSGILGEDIAIKIRWFVVIRPNKGYCSCLPIQTYGARGVGKPHVVKSDHAIIYTGNKEPKQQKDEYPKDNREAPMLSPGIRVDPKGRTERLDPNSRINFNKIYTIEHNVKVYEFGDVHRDSRRTLQRHFQACWQIDEEAAQKGKVLADYIAQQEEKQIAEVNKAAEESEISSDSEDDDGEPDAHWEADALNKLVAHCVNSWRQSTNPEDHDRAQYLANANSEEQKEYLRMMGVDVNAQSQSSEQQSTSTRRRRRRRQSSAS